MRYHRASSLPSEALRPAFNKRVLVIFRILGFGPQTRVLAGEDCQCPTVLAETNDFFRHTVWTVSPAWPAAASSRAGLPGRRRLVRDECRPAPDGKPGRGQFREDLPGEISLYPGRLFDNGLRRAKVILAAIAEVAKSSKEMNRSNVREAIQNSHVTTLQSSRESRVSG